MLLSYAWWLLCIKILVNNLRFIFNVKNQRNLVWLERPFQQYYHAALWSTVTKHCMVKFLEASAVPLCIQENYHWKKGSLGETVWEAGWMCSVSLPLAQNFLCMFLLDMYYCVGFHPWLNPKAFDINMIIVGSPQCWYWSSLVKILIFALESPDWGFSAKLTFVIWRCKSMSDCPIEANFSGAYVK